MLCEVMVEALFTLCVVARFRASKNEGLSEDRGRAAIGSLRKVINWGNLWPWDAGNSDELGQIRVWYTQDDVKKSTGN